MTSPAAQFLVLLAIVIAVLSLGVPTWALVTVVVLTVVAGLSELGATATQLEGSNDAR